jgi:hypothetical protein
MSITIGSTDHPKRIGVPSVCAAACGHRIWTKADTVSLSKILNLTHLCWATDTKIGILDMLVRLGRGSPNGSMHFSNKFNVK